MSERAAAGDERLYYLHGHDLFGPEDADDLPDDLHPSPAGYRLMGERFKALVLDVQLGNRYVAG